MKRILIYGGSFDPPHCGHLETARTVQQTFKFDHFFFVPCKQSVLKQARIASSEQRVDMLNIALEPYVNTEFKFEIDTRELTRDTPSFMIDTLQSFHEDYKNHEEVVSLTLLLGMDAFLTLPRWHQWKSILMCCDLLVMQRAGHEHETHIPTELQTQINNSPCRLRFFDAGNYAISSTALRSQLEAGEALEQGLLPEAVYDYIKRHELYQGPSLA